MWISKDDGILRKEDFEAQARIVEEYIKNTTWTINILELACWRWSNTLYLAKKYHQHTFIWLDYSKDQLWFTENKKLENTTFIQWDYHNLPLENSSQDIIFIVEALCYSQDKNQVFSEISRVLKVWWRCIVIDWYASRNTDQNAEIENLALLLSAKWMALQWVESYEKVLKYGHDNWLIFTKDTNYSTQVLPSCDRLQKISLFFLKLWLISKLLIRYTPHYFSINLFSWVLMSDLLKQWSASYFMTVFTKK